VLMAVLESREQRLEQRLTQSVQAVVMAALQGGGSSTATGGATAATAGAAGMAFGMQARGPEVGQVGSGPTAAVSPAASQWRPLQTALRGASCGRGGGVVTT